MTGQNDQSIEWVVNDLRAQVNKCLLLRLMRSLMARPCLYKYSLVLIVNVTLNEQLLRLQVMKDVK